MDLSIKYNGVDITDSIDYRSIILVDRYGGMLDSIKMSIDDADNLWSKYGTAKGDEIIIKADRYSTGSMYLTQSEYQNGLFNIDAVSVKPRVKRTKSKIWRDISLSEILNDCAKNTGLTLKTYGVEDYRYESVAQIQKTDLDFTNDVCKREGYSLKVDNNCLIVFNERYLESQEASLTITPEDVNADYSFIHSSEGLNNVTVMHYDHVKGLIEQTATDHNMYGGSEVINCKVSSHAEALRFAYGHLRDRNRRHFIGYLSMPFNDGISAGTLINIKGFGEYDSKYAVIETRHNIKSESTSLTLRKTLSY